MTRRRRVTRVLLFAITVAGVCLRAFHLADRPVWFDEAFSWTLVTQFSWSEMVERTGRDVHPPFYYLVLRCWTCCFGASPAAMRSLSVALAAATMVVFYLLCRDVFSADTPADEKGPVAERAGLVAALLIALSAAHVHWSYEARMYTLATALLGFSTWALVRALKSPRRAAAWWTAYALSSAALLYTHNYGLFSVAAQWAYLICRFAHQPRSWFEMFADKRFRGAAAAVASVAAMYAPWLPVLQAQKSRVQADYWIPAVDPWSVPEAWLALIAPANRAIAGAHAEAFAAAAGVVATLAVFIWRGGEGRWLVACMVVCPVALATLVSLVSVSVIVGRHFLLAYLFLLCAAARVAAGLPRLERGLLLALLLVDSAAALARHRDSLRADAAPGIRGAVEHVRDGRRPGEPIVVLHPCIYFSTRYYAANDSAPHLYLDGKRPMHYTGAPILRDDDCWQAADLKRVRGRRVWVLDTTGYSAGFRQRAAMPAGWRRVGSSKSFRGLYFFEGDISVDVYEWIEPTATAKKSGGAR